MIMKTMVMAMMVMAMAMVMTRRKTIAETKI